MRKTRCVRVTILAVVDRLLCSSQRAALGAGLRFVHKTRRDNEIANHFAEKGHEAQR